MIQEMTDVSLSDLSEPFHETIAWCEMSALACDATPGFSARSFFQKLSELDVRNMERQWRLIEKSAHKQGGPFRRFVFTEPGRLLSLTDEALCGEMARVAEARKQSLVDREADLSRAAVARGALICFEPALSMYDGAAMMGSGGFFDVENFPPADTWIAYISKRYSHKADSGFLLSWVPEELVDLADEGVRVEPSGSLQWADEESDAFVQEICRQLHFACALPA